MTKKIDGFGGNLDSAFDAGPVAWACKRDGTYFLRRTLEHVMQEDHSDWRPLYLAPTIPDGWISVEDRLPELDVPVLAFYHGGIGAVFRGEGDDGWLLSAHHMGLLDDLDSYECDDNYEVTHWMPLPAPPLAAVKEPK
jgi:hypothetical protein